MLTATTPTPAMIAAHGCCFGAAAPEAGADSGATVPLWAGILAGGLLATGGTLAFLNFKKKSRTAW